METCYNIRAVKDAVFISIFTIAVNPTWTPLRETKNIITHDTCLNISKKLLVEKKMFGYSFNW